MRRGSWTGLGFNCGVFVFALCSGAQTATTGAIEGRVVDAATGAPIAGVEVHYRLMTGPAQASAAKTDAQGRYRLEKLAAGKYGFFGVMPMSSTYSSNSRIVTLAEGQELKGIDFKASKATVLSGRVLDAEKRPVVGAMVMVRTFAYMSGRLTSGNQGVRTNDLGEYRATLMRPGAVRLLVEQKSLPIRKRPAGAKQVDAEPVLATVRTWYPNTTTHETSLEVKLGPGEVREGLDIVLLKERTVCVRGQVRDTATWAGTRVHAQIVESVPGGGSTTADGFLQPGDDFEACGIPPGSYTFRAVTQDDGADARYAAEVFTVTKQAVRLPDVMLRPLPDIQGNLKVEGGGDKATLAGPVLVSTSVEDSYTIVMSGGSARITEPGPFALRAVRPEEVWLRISTPSGTYVKSATVRGIDVTRKPFHAMDGELEVVVGLDGPEVTGQVVDGEGKPVADAMVVMAVEPLPAVTGLNDMVPSAADQNGSFALRGMAPGKYRVVVFPETALDALNPAVFREQGSRGEVVTLAAKEKRSLRCVYKP